MLVNQPLIPSARYGQLAAAGSYSPPMGLCSLAAVVKHQGHEVSIVDAQSLGLDYEGTLRHVEKNRPSLIGITAFTSTFPSGKKLAEMVSSRVSPRPLIVFGGPHVTAMPEDSMRECNAIDIVAIGEGEETLRELLDALAHKRHVSSVNGIAFRDNGTINTTPKREFIRDLDTLPFPAWPLLTNFPRAYSTQHFSIAAGPSSSIITSRGCPKRCIFCDRSVFGRHVRGNSAGYIVEMMEYLYNIFGVRSFNFEDDSFLVLQKRLIEYCELVIKKNLRITWACQTPVDTVSKELLPLMRRAGCAMINFGIESGSQRILDRMQKGTSVEQIEEAIRLTHESGILTRGLMIVGFFGENKETMDETLAFLKCSKLDDISWHYFTPLPGSEAWGHTREYGAFTPQWERMNLYQPTFIPSGLTAEDLISFVKKSYRQFYFRPSVVSSYLKRLRSVGQFRQILKGTSALFSYVVRRRD